MHPGFWQLIQGSRNFYFVSLHYFRLIQVQAFAIRSEKSPSIHASGQISIPAFLQAFEIMQIYTCICSYLSKRSISFFAFCFKIRCKRSHGKIRVVQKGYYCDQKTTGFFFGRHHFTWRPAFCQLITGTYKRFRVPDSMDSGWNLISCNLSGIRSQGSEDRIKGLEGPQMRLCDFSRVLQSLPPH